jgi:hypothetical protein
MSIQCSPLKWYALATVAVGAAPLVDLRMRGSIGPLNFAPFLLAVLASASVGGTGPGLWAAGLSLASRCFIAASADRSGSPLAIGVYLACVSAVEILCVYLIAARRGGVVALGHSERRFRLLTEALPQLVGRQPSIDG